MAWLCLCLLGVLTVPQNSYLDFTSRFLEEMKGEMYGKMDKYGNQKVKWVGK